MRSPNTSFYNPHVIFNGQTINCEEVLFCEPYNEESSTILFKNGIQVAISLVTGTSKRFNHIELCKSIAGNRI